MKKTLKILGIVMGALVLLLVVAVGVVNHVLKSRLTEILQTRVAPVIEERLKVKAEFGHAGISIFRGSAEFNDIKIGNPAGFETSRAFGLKRAALDIALGKAIKEQVFDVSDLTVKDCDVTIERNKDGKLNLKVIADTVAPEKESGEPEESGEEPAGKPAGREPGDIPKAVLTRLELSPTVRYLDNKLSKPLDMSFKLAVHGTNISTFDLGDQGGGKMEITGALAGKSDVCKLNLAGTIAPLADPMKPTFNLSGDIANIDMTVAQVYLAMAGISSCSGMSLKLNMIAENGVFDDASNIMFEMRNVTMGKGIAGIRQLPLLRVPVPLTGTVTDPKADFLKALPKAVAASAKGSASALIPSGLLRRGSESGETQEPADDTDGKDDSGDKKEEGRGLLRRLGI